MIFLSPRTVINPCVLISESIELMKAAVSTPQPQPNKRLRQPHEPVPVIAVPDLQDVQPFMSEPDFVDEEHHISKPQSNTDEHNGTYDLRLLSDGNQSSEASVKSDLKHQMIQALANDWKVDPLKCSTKEAREVLHVPPYGFSEKEFKWIIGLKLSGVQAETRKTQTDLCLAKQCLKWQDRWLEEGMLNEDDAVIEREIEDFYGPSCSSTQHVDSSQRNEGFYEPPIATTWVSLPEKNTKDGQASCHDDSSNFKDSGIHMDDSFAEASLPEVPPNSANKIAGRHVYNEATTVKSSLPTFSVGVTPSYGRKYLPPQHKLLNDNGQRDWKSRIEAPHDLVGFARLRSCPTEDATGSNVFAGVHDVGDDKPIQASSSTMICAQWDTKGAPSNYFSTQVFQSYTKPSPVTGHSFENLAFNDATFQTISAGKQSDHQNPIDLDGYDPLKFATATNFSPAHHRICCTVQQNPATPERNGIHAKTGAPVLKPQQNTFNTSTHDCVGDSRVNTSATSLPSNLTPNHEAAKSNVSLQVRVHSSPTGATQAEQSAISKYVQDTSQRSCGRRGASSTATDHSSPEERVNLVEDNYHSSEDTKRLHDGNNTLTLPTPQPSQDQQPMQQLPVPIFSNRTTCATPTQGQILHTPQPSQEQQSMQTPYTFTNHTIWATPPQGQIL